MKKILIAIAAIALFAGCEGSVKDGKIPAKYISVAQKYNGTYSGQFEGQSMDLNLNVDSLGYVLVTFKNALGANSLLSDCQAQVGKLKSFSASEKENRVKSATFKFTAKGCDIDGREAYFTFPKSGGIEVAIVEREHTVTTQTCHHDQYGGYCIPDTQVYVDSWLEGFFN
ncbi:MAG: hypothetical protein V4736_04890 [Bdellovibrionota bacterium]